MRKITRFEDNGGADIIEIVDNENGTFTFTVGNCCVFSLGKTGTITEITAWLTEISFSVDYEFAMGRKVKNE